MSVVLTGAIRAQTTVVSNEEAMLLAHRVETSINSGNADVLDHIFDYDILMDRAVKKSKVLKSYGKDFVESFKGGFVKNIGPNFSGKIIVNIKNGNYRCLRSYEKDGVRHILFRESGNGGLNYHDYALIRVKDSVKASDCFLYRSDEELSSFMAKTTDIMLTGTSNVKELTDEMRSFSNLTSLIKQGDYLGAKAFFDKLDQNSKDSKAIQGMYLTICEKLGLDVYQQALEKYVSLYPDAANGYMRRLDLYFSKADPVKGMMTVNKLDSLMGKDPFLDFYRGVFYLQAGGKTQSIPFFENVYNYDAGILGNTMALIKVYTESNRVDKAKHVIAEGRKTNLLPQEYVDGLCKTYPALK